MTSTTSRTEGMADHGDKEGEARNLYERLTTWLRGQATDHGDKIGGGVLVLAGLEVGSRAVL